MLIQKKGHNLMKTPVIALIVSLFLLTVFGCMDREALDSSVNATQMEILLLSDKVQELKSKMADLETAIADLSSVMGDLYNYDSCGEYSDAIYSFHSDVEYYYSESEDVLNSVESDLVLLSYSVIRIRNVANKRIFLP